MLTRLIVDLYGWIIEIFLWFTLLIAGIAGYQSVVRYSNLLGGFLKTKQRGGFSALSPRLF